jgi:hypothetical protein
VSARTLVVGDVHGCADELAELLDRVGPERVVLVGDLFTRGPDPLGVWRHIDLAGAEGVLGNHDAAMLDIVDQDRRTEDRPAALAVRKLASVEDEWLPWLRERPLFLPVDRWLVVHAGLHPTGGREQTTRKMALTMRRWPDEQKGQPFWWQVYEGEQAVLFGHDAMRGHVKVLREGRPLLVGLDTGCVYGGQLSGWLVEEEELVQVRARRTYAEPSAPERGPKGALPP